MFASKHNLEEKVTWGEETLSLHSGRWWHNLVLTDESPHCPCPLIWTSMTISWPPQWHSSVTWGHPHHSCPCCWGFRDQSMQVSIPRRPLAPWSGHHIPSAMDAMQLSFSTGEQMTRKMCQLLSLLLWFSKGFPISVSGNSQVLWFTESLNPSFSCSKSLSL